MISTISSCVYALFMCYWLCGYCCYDVFWFVFFTWPQLRPVVCCLMYSVRTAISWFFTCFSGTPNRSEESQRTGSKQPPAGRQQTTPQDERQRRLALRLPCQVGPGTAISWLYADSAGAIRKQVQYAHAQDTCARAHSSVAMKQRRDRMLIWGIY